MYPQAAAITDDWPATIVVLLIGISVISFLIVRSKKK
ncbi:hypothetical protein SGLAM104S_02827 [Streptomyces glaucescens]|jgi:uncharacterized protein (DUF983 family)